MRIATNPTWLWIEPQLRDALYEFNRRVVWYRWMVRDYEPHLYGAKDLYEAARGPRAVVDAARAAVLNASAPLQMAVDEYLERVEAKSRGEDIGAQVPLGFDPDFMSVPPILTHDDAGHVVVVNRDGG